MSEYSIGKIYANDLHLQQQANQLLEINHIRAEKNLDYRCAMLDQQDNLIATGGLLGNSLRCLAVSPEHQGEGLMNEIITHLINIQFERGNTHLFLYTKTESAKFFHQLGFYPIAQAPNLAVFMENKRTGFQDYLHSLQQASPNLTPQSHIAAIVMNANPFTLGHQYLIEKAAAENDLVHLFILSEDISLFPFEIRKMLIQQGIAHLDNVICHDTKSYLISQATFPSYFQQDEEAVIESNVQIDLAIFTQIAKQLHITKRYVGEEPFSQVTKIYNQMMQQQLQTQYIDVIEIARKPITQSNQSQAISASTVRQAIKENNWQLVQQSVPASTFTFLQSPLAEPIITKIQHSENVKHY